MATAAAPETVTDVFQAKLGTPEADPRTKVDELSATQKAGMGLAVGVGLLIVCVIAWVCWASYPVPIPQFGTDDAAAKAMIENYKTLSVAAGDGPMKVFDSVVVKALLPIFTTILGYIFGTREVRNS